MEAKAKQITLLTKRISKIQNKGVKDIPNFTNVFIDNQELAEELLKYYQPKLPKDSVVLSREEYGRLKFMENYGYLDVEKKASKETAEKYHKAMRKAIHERDYIEGYAEIGLQEENDEIAKQFDVEIKE